MGICSLPSSYSIGLLPGNRQLVIPMQSEMPQATLRLLLDKDCEARILCSRFSRHAASILNLTLHVQQRMQWLEDGMKAARLQGDERLEARHLIDLGSCYAVAGNEDKARE